MKYKIIQNNRLVFYVLLSSHVQRKDAVIKSNNPLYRKSTNKNISINIIGFTTQQQLIYFTNVLTLNSNVY